MATDRSEALLCALADVVNRHATPDALVVPLGTTAGGLLELRTFLVEILTAYTLAGTRPTPAAASLLMSAWSNYRIDVRIRRGLISEVAVCLLGNHFELGFEPPLAPAETWQPPAPWLALGSWAADTSMIALPQTAHHGNVGASLAPRSLDVMRAATLATLEQDLWLSIQLARWAALLKHPDATDLVEFIAPRDPRGVVQLAVAVTRRVLESRA